MGKRAHKSIARTPKETAEKMMEALPKVSKAASSSSGETSYRTMFGQVLEELVSSRAMVTSCFSHIQGAKREMAAEEAAKDLLPEMSAVSKIPPELMIAEVARKSDLTVEQITNLRDADH